MPMIHYMLADDHKIFRQGMKVALQDDPRLKLIGEASNGVELMEQLKQMVPDVILLDIKMPEMDGMEAIAQIKEHYPDVKVLILSMYDDEHFILHLMEAGASGYLIKNADPEDIKTAIHAAFENGYYFNDHVSNVMLKTLVQKNIARPRFRDSVQLNDKEKEVLRLICKEHTNTEIAKLVFLSPRTVEGIRSTLLEKIGVRNTAGLVLYAVKNGIYEE